MKKALLSIALCGGLLGMSAMAPALTADAATKSATGTSFTKAWSKSVNTGDGAGVLTYGYNTAWINEDFAHAYHASKTHFASISNGNGSHVSSSVGAGKTAKVEVRHAGSTVTYTIHY
ncbi:MULTISPECIES: hypothetical protein [unclassified Sutcliffiella]|uniref:mediterrocin family bacteriocin n=1 Tax=unclassified Sutcliffiella TaxID=2837532 RepID=UPI0030D3D605